MGDALHLRRESRREDSSLGGRRRVRPGHQEVVTARLGSRATGRVAPPGRTANRASGTSDRHHRATPAAREKGRAAEHKAGELLG